VSTKACVKIGGVYLYQHWDGYYLPGKVARALERGKSRWNDPPYLARIIFSEMIRDELNELTGYGIYATEPYVNILIEVSTEYCVVEMGDRAWTFTEFISEWRDKDNAQLEGDIA